MKRMLINATQPEELRVALVDGQRLYDLDIESAGKEQKKSNIYKGRIVRIEPSLEAAFVDYGSKRHGFLPFKEIARSLIKSKSDDGDRGRASIKDCLETGQEFIVQVEKEERGNKGAALTTSVSLAGRYLVLMPNNPRAGGVSRQIEGADRSEVREAMSVLDIPQGMGLIVRTAGVGKNSDELQWDLDYLLQLWDAIKKAAKSKSAPFLIYHESDLVIRAIRDYLRKDISEIWIDDQDVYHRAREFMEQVMPINLQKLKLYTERDPLFSRYQIEGQIETAFSREVTLPSGGSVIIDHSEALTSIDINSARATKGEDIEETALSTNLEAADEISRQLRLRDLGGLIVIDFIDMVSSRNQREVENRLKDALKVDRARVQIGRISRFGLLEMSRQRLRPSLGESSHIPCPRCDGQGTIRGIESMALAVLRIIEEECMKEMTAKVIAQLPVDAATFLLNEKRQSISEVEERLDVEVIIVPDLNMETPQYEVRRVRLTEADMRAHDKASYTMQSVEAQPIETRITSTQHKSETPAIKHIFPSQPEPAAARKNGESRSLISRLFGGLFGEPEAKPVKQPQQQPDSRSTPARTSSKDRDRDRDRDRGQDRDRDRDNRARGKKRGSASRKQSQQPRQDTSQPESDAGQKKKRDQRQKQSGKKRDYENKSSARPPRSSNDSSNRRRRNSNTGENRDSTGNVTPAVSENQNQSANTVVENFNQSPRADEIKRPVQSVASYYSQKGASESAAGAANQRRDVDAYKKGQERPEQSTTVTQDNTYEAGSRISSTISADDEDKTITRAQWTAENSSTPANDTAIEQDKAGTKKPDMQNDPNHDYGTYNSSASAVVDSAANNNESVKDSGSSTPVQTDYNSGNSIQQSPPADYALNSNSKSHPPVSTMKQDTAAENRQPVFPGVTPPSATGAGNDSKSDNTDFSESTTIPADKPELKPQEPAQSTNLVNGRQDNYNSGSHGEALRDADKKQDGDKHE